MNPDRLVDELSARVGFKIDRTDPVILLGLALNEFMANHIEMGVERLGEHTDDQTDLIIKEMAKFLRVLDDSLSPVGRAILEFQESNVELKDSFKGVENTIKRQRLLGLLLGASNFLLAVTLFVLLIL